MIQRHISKIIPGILLLIVIIGWFFVLQDQPQMKESVLKEEFFADGDHFAAAQYYFNQDDDPGGAYDLNLAREYYAKAIQADAQQNILLWYQAGRVDFISGRFNEALQKFDKQIELYGDQVPNVHYMIGLTNGFIARQSGKDEDWDKAAAGFIKFIEFVPASPWARTDLSWVYFSQGKYEMMVPVLEEGLNSNPENPWLLNMYGLALMNTEKLTEANENFLKAQEFASKLTPLDWGRSYPGNNPKDWPQGLAEFQLAIEKNLEIVSEQL